MIGKDLSNIYDIKYLAANGTIAQGATLQFQIPQGTYLTNSLISYQYSQNDLANLNQVVRCDCTPFISKCVVMLDGVKVYDVLNLSTLQRQWYQKNVKGVQLFVGDQSQDVKYFKMNQKGSAGSVDLWNEIKLNHFLAFLFDEYQKSFTVNQQMTISITTQFITKIGCKRNENYVDQLVTESTNASTLKLVNLKLKQIVQSQEQNYQRIVQQLMTSVADGSLLTFYVDSSQMCLYNIISYQKQPANTIDDFIYDGAVQSIKIRRNNQLILESVSIQQLSQQLQNMDQENSQQENIWSGILQYECSGEQIQFQINNTPAQEVYITTVVVPKPQQQ